MELDELKNRWLDLDKQLKVNKLLNENIILKMIKGKMDTSLNRLLFWDIFSIIVVLLVLPIIVYLLYNSPGEYIFGDITVIYAGVLCILYLILYTIKIIGLIKIDTTKDISKNIYHANRYKVLVKKERIIELCIILPSLALLCILSYTEAKVSFPIWFLMINLLIIVSLFSYWYYKRIYKKNITSILESLDEIKELREENENTTLY